MQKIYLKRWYFFLMMIVLSVSKINLFVDSRQMMVCSTNIFTIIKAGWTCADRVCQETVNVE